MQEPTSEPGIRRILVALDASRHSLAALEAAVELATRLKADLVGLFVEDINLVRLAGLPFAHEVRYPSAVIEQLSSPRLEQELRVQAARARRALAAAAEQAEVAWSFRVVRGQVAAEVLAAAVEADLLSLGTASWPSIRRARLGSTARLVTAEAPRAVLLLQPGDRLGQPVVVTYDGSAASRQALAIAHRLVRAGGQQDPAALCVLVLNRDDRPEKMEQLRQEVAAWLHEHALQAKLRSLAGVDVAALARVVRAERGGLLVLAGETPPIRAETVQILLDQIDCPILLVRSGMPPASNRQT
jgi:nucleotide-binding universal stress UspA family protein